MLIIGVSTLGYLIFLYANQTNSLKKPAPVTSVQSDQEEKEVVPEKQPEKPVVLPTNELTEDVKLDASQIINDSLKKVVTIYTETSQGTGFLMNNQGDILTNAHVVEGAYSVSVLDSKDFEYTGTVIGYSNSIDVAIVRVPDLAGQQPLTLDYSGNVAIAEEVIALGSPLGLRNTATLGYITGVNRTFYIGDRVYNNILQMSAHIEPGSSGGPLLSLQTGKVIAINSAKSLLSDLIGFSIPIKEVSSYINEWITSPLTEEQLFALFYNDDGLPYYQSEGEDEDWYFEGGDYSSEEEYYYDWYEYDDNYEDEENYGGEYDNSYESENEDTHSYEYDESYEYEDNNGYEYDDSYEFEEELNQNEPYDDSQINKKESSHFFDGQSDNSTEEND